MTEGFRGRLDVEKPAINIAADDDVDRKVIAYVLEGIEEEGIPASIEFDPAGGSGAVGMAFRAASGSRLGVGIGLTMNEAAVHYEKLSEEKPLVLKSLPSKADDLRTMGSNAARLVKRMPFKN
jgi:hypothetical protein